MSETPSSDSARTDKHAGFYVGPNSHDGMPEFMNSESAQSLAVGCISLDDMGEPVRPFLDALGVLIDTQHIVSKTNKGLRDGTAEARKPDDDDVVVRGDIASQQ
jgi:hypothetical protein